MANRTKWTAKKEGQFLEQLAATGNVTRACRASDVSRTSAYDRRDELPAFAAAWDDAVLQYAERLEDEADRRAVEGTVKTIYYQGLPVGEETQYSDTLLMFRLKALKPDAYRERVQQQVVGDPNAPVQVQITRTVVREGGTE
ncbi:hypothetical protein DEIPH_ctg017orf0230 [Deinococcus phoenicis]|uniref:Terminase small subunit n=1 Tax=Deinococcus phoenicis TaxID=1476583 RepID=A0A016QSG9_9DEIO|nr:hypothetical protein [Deinococcus phoenicis]EYB68852.1 hypothetical protein DEIPH_ctg017orf0230 [Deinococcus phoenicis]